MFGIREKAAKTARQAGLLTGGLLLCAIGTGFLTAAGWLALAPIVGAATTATIIAAIYLGVGCIIIGVAAQGQTHSSPPPKPQTTQAPDAPPILQAFMYGLQAGAQSDRARH